MDSKMLRSILQLTPYPADVYQEINACQTTNVGRF